MGLSGGCRERFGLGILLTDSFSQMIHFQLWTDKLIETGRRRWLSGAGGKEEVAFNGTDCQFGKMVRSRDGQW